MVNLRFLENEIKERDVLPSKPVLSVSFIQLSSYFYYNITYIFKYTSGIKRNLDKKKSYQDK